MWARFVWAALAIVVFTVTQVPAEAQPSAVKEDTAIPVTPIPAGARPAVIATAAGKWATSFGPATAVITSNHDLRFDYADGATKVEVTLLGPEITGAKGQITGSFLAPKARQNRHPVLRTLPVCSMTMGGAEFHGTIYGSLVTNARGDILAINGFYAPCFDPTKEDALHQFNARKAP